MPGSPWSAQSSPGPSLGWISWSGSCLSSGGRASPGPQHQDQAVKSLPVSPVLCTRAASTAPKISPKSQGFPHAGSKSVLVVLLFPGTGRARKTQKWKSCSRSSQPPLISPFSLVLRGADSFQLFRSSGDNDLIGKMCVQSKPSADPGDGFGAPFSRGIHP